MEIRPNFFYPKNRKLFRLHQSKTSTIDTPGSKLKIYPEELLFFVLSLTLISRLTKFWRGILVWGQKRRGLLWRGQFFGRRGSKSISIATDVIFYPFKCGSQSEWRVKTASTSFGDNYLTLFHSWQPLIKYLNPAQLVARFFHTVRRLTERWWWVLRHVDGLWVAGRRCWGCSGTWVH